MKDEFEKLVAAGKISRHHIDPLVALTDHGYCFHKSWGFGKITHVDTVFGRFNIDFKTRQGHSMDLTFAANSLTPLPQDHILVQKEENLEALKKMAAVNHLELVRVVLQSYGGHRTAEQIEQDLVPDVISEDWRKWWEEAKREMKKDGHFQVPLKRSEPVLYHEREVLLQDHLMEEFRSAKGLKARIAVAVELLKNLPDLTDKQTAIAEAIQSLNEEIASHQRTMPPLALEGIFTRDELRAAAGVAPAEGETASAEVWAHVDHPSRVLEQVPVGKHKRALESFKSARPGNWHEVLLLSLNTVGFRLCGECVSLLVQEGKLEDLKKTLARLITQHSASSELLLWLVKERSSTFADILGPEVFRAALTAIERDQFQEKRSNRLRDYIVEDQELMVELIESADIEVIKDLTRALQLSPSFGDIDKRSLLARIVKHSPAAQALIAGEHTRQDTSLVVSWESLEQRKREYDKLVHKQIPENARDIALARSYGDLRENHEYKSAKEKHRLLMRRKSELESDLVRARGTDFRDARSDAVSVGTRVRATYLDGQHSESFAILGAWDFDEEKHVISYLSPIARAMLNRKPGDEVEFELDGVIRRWRIDAVEPCVTTGQPNAQQESAAADSTGQGAASAPLEPVAVADAEAPSAPA